MARKRKSHTAAVKDDNTVSELASLHGTHPTLVHAWKNQLVDNAAELFQSCAKTSTVEHDALQVQRDEQIGPAQDGAGLAQKKLPVSVERKHAWVDAAVRVLSVS